MLTFLVASAFAITKFPGGSANDFAAALADASNQNVMIVQGEDTAIKACEFDISDLNELARAIRNQTDLAILPGTDLILSDQKLSPDLVGEENSGSSTPEGVKLRAPAIADGKVTFKTEKKDLLDVGSSISSFSKPVQMHWIYKDARASVQVKDMPEADFLRWLAKAVGGRFVDTAKEYTIELDATEIRRRAVNAILAVKTDDLDKAEAAMEKKKQAFRVASINSLNANQIAQALATPGGETRIALSANNPLTRTATTYVQDLAQYQQSQVGQRTQRGGRRRGGRTQGSAIGVLQRVDPSRTSYLIVNAQFEVNFEIPVRDGRGRPSGVVHF